MAVYFDEFLDVLYSDPGEVDPDIGRCGLDIRQFLAKGFFR
ncbi:hypothetical protein [Methanoregula sp.]